MVSAPQDHAANGADIAEVPAPAEQDVFVLHHDAVGRVHVHPPELGSKPAADPGMRLIGALAFDLTRWRSGADIAGGIARRYSNPAQAADHGVGEILAYALPARHDLGYRRGDGGDAGAKAEFGVESFVELQQGVHDRAPLGE